MHSTWVGDATPLEVLHRNFYFTTFFDPSAYRLLDIIGAERIMLEVDYPHSDSTWPDTQELIHEQIRDLDPTVQRDLTSANAARVYRHPLPAAVRP